jgi:hypothetical protein
MRKWWSGIASIAAAAVLLLVLAIVLSALDSDVLHQWPLLQEWIGTSVIVVGVVALACAPAPASARGVLHLVRPIALMLAGAVLVGGGWGAALGLALLASASVAVDRRSAKPDGDSST